MMRGTGRSWRIRHCSLLIAAALLGTCAGCTSATVSATAYETHARIDPEGHGLQAETVMTLRREPADGPAAQWVTLDFVLNRALQIESITAEGARVLRHKTYEPAPDEADAAPNATSGDPARVETGPIPPGGKQLRPLYLTHRLTLADVTAAPCIRLTYSGRLAWQWARPSRGVMSFPYLAAHIGPEGVYLGAASYWYPVWCSPSDVLTDAAAQYRLTIEPPPGMELAAGAWFDAEASRTSGKLVWDSLRPSPTLVLAGGPHLVKERQADGVRVSVHYRLPKQAEDRDRIAGNADLFLGMAADCLRRYSPIIGPYPCKDLALVESLHSFQSFACPGLVMVQPLVFLMPRQACEHSVVEHELLHQWWGTGIYVDPTDGNWCEALTSYVATCHAYVLDGNPDEARQQRRRYCKTIGAMAPEDDKPLGDFWRPDGPPPPIGYGKGAMVFHMLATRIGQENFWSAMRRLTDEYFGRHASWRTLQDLCEQESAVKLDRFMQDWVRGTGIPRIELADAVWLVDEHAVEVTLTQGDTDFELHVPVRLVYGDGSSRDELALLDGPAVTVRLPSPERVRSVVLDPEYQVLRRLGRQEAGPNRIATRSAAELLIVTPCEPTSLSAVIAAHDFCGWAPKSVTRRTVAEVTDADLAAGSVLVTGDAVCAEPIQRLLARTDCPVTWESGGFRVDGTLYDSPAHGVLCTVYHPDAPDRTITLYYANSSAVVGGPEEMDGCDSLVVFEGISKAVGNGRTCGSAPILRRDFGAPQTLEVR